MKKLIALLFVLIPFGIGAQEIKIAIVNQAEIFNVMPDVSTVENQLAALHEQYQKELKIMNDEYTKKFSDYMAQQDSLTENIKLRRQQDIEDLRTRIENYMTSAQQDMEKKQMELYAPIQEKIQNAIKAVGEEKGYTYIINPHPQMILYVGNSAIDATPFVKTKLGLK
ncbi:MAG: OmpH family outer membrane protein [Tannerella sp.]|jgi:outer membrane protein|nr:OmpH family outer membrane protein [Tannerella sp.]